jgi:hypothetical protein
MKNSRIVVYSLIVGLLLSTPVYAWNDTGHKVIARIAWNNMSQQARKNVIALLRSAPQDSGLRGLFHTSDPAAVRDELFFVRAATWPDIVRDTKFPARRAKFHKQTWHFINFFWQQDASNTPSDLDRDPEPKPENIVERLGRFQTSVVDSSMSQGDRAIQLAWILHLAGDIHQPLHCSARVTASEPNGDQGGNLFKLDRTGQLTLHGFWDGILDSTFRVERGERPDDFIKRVGLIIMARNPKPSAAALNLGQFEAWAKASHETTKKVAYPVSLERQKRPSELYRRSVQTAAEPAIALAGYRLAAMLNSLFGS